MMINPVPSASHDVMTRYVRSVAMQECEQVLRIIPKRRRFVERRFRVERRLRLDPSVDADHRAQDRRRLVPFCALMD